MTQKNKLMRVSREILWRCMAITIGLLILGIILKNWEEVIALITGYLICGAFTVWHIHRLEKKK